MNCAGLSTHVNGGYFTQVKQPATVSFKPFKESLTNPEILVTDFAKMDHGMCNLAPHFHPP